MAEVNDKNMMFSGSLTRSYAEKLGVYQNEITYVSAINRPKTDFDSIPTRYIVVAGTTIIPEHLSPRFYAVLYYPDVVVISKSPPTHSMQLLDFLFADITGCEHRSKTRDSVVRPYESYDTTLRQQILFPAATDKRNYIKTTTSYYGFMQMWNFLKMNLGDLSKRTIVDATSGVGGDALRFAQNCAFVHAIELEKDIGRYIMGNYDLMVSCGLISPGNFRFHSGNYSDYIFAGSSRAGDLAIPPGSILYLDPNWKGQGNSSDIADDSSLVIGGISFTEMPMRVHANFSHIVYKVPLSANVSFDFTTPILNSEKNNSYKIVVVTTKKRPGNAAFSSSSSSSSRRP